MTAPLHDYQELGVEFLRHQPAAGLFLDCGYGKTRIVLEALEDRHLPALVVAPKRVAEHVWHAERDKWRPDLTLERAIGDPQERRRSLDAGAAVTVVSRDNLGDVRSRYKTLVIDELSGYKSKGARWKAARNLARQAENVWGLTGTPAPNGLMDLFYQVQLLDGGQRFDTSIQRFRDRYFNPGRRLPTGTIISWTLKDGAEAAIHKAIEDICLSITDRLVLPPITGNVIEFDLPPKVRAAYKEFERELLIDLDLLGGDVHTAANNAVLTGKLSQITAGFLYQDNRAQVPDQLHALKLDALAEVRAGTSDNLLVFYRFTEERDAIMERHPEAVPITKTGAIEAWSRGEVPMLLAHPAGAAHGLNLQDGGHTIVWMTLDWSLEIWRQANARLYRQGQQHPVVIHVIEASHTIDGFIRQRVQSKKVTHDSLIAHLASPV